MEPDPIKGRRLSAGRRKRPRTDQAGRELGELLGHDPGAAVSHASAPANLAKATPVRGRGRRGRRASLLPSSAGPSRRREEGQLADAVHSEAAIAGDRALEYGDINELGREITLSKSYDTRNNLTPCKNRQRRKVPMSDRLRGEIDQLERKGRTIIGRLRDGKPLGYFTMRDFMVDLYEKTGVTRPPKSWHALRHSFCSRLAENGVPVNIIRDLAGHNSIETTLRYIHSNKEQKAEALRTVFGQHLASSHPGEETRTRTT